MTSLTAYMAQCQQIAQTHFGIKTLRSAQTEVLKSIYEKKFVLATLPTGSGKTLLYAVPAMIFSEGPVIVISPLISLMRDQVRRMEAANIPCVLFTSDQSELERKKSHSDFWDTNTKLIFVSPERFLIPSFFNKINKLNPSMIVIDEAHCVISWGHNFRPEYSEIGKYLSQLKPSRVLAVTATAAGLTRQEMVHKIFPENISISQFISKPIGEHIFIRSIRMFTLEEQQAKLFEILMQTTSQIVIVYFFSRKQCEEFALRIKEKKINAVAYHAGLTKDERMNVETYIHQTKQKTVICATTAFGLGVDISNVTLVVTYGFPENIEEFLQMVGRAGRSGQASEGILLWTGSDPVKRDHMFKDNFPSPTKFMDDCQKIAPFMPKQEWESVFVPKDRILQILYSDSKRYKGAQQLEGFLGALRVCQMTEDMLPNEDYYQIKFTTNISLENLLSALPEGVTKRKKVLDGVKSLMNENLFQHSGASLVFSIQKILNSSESSQEVVEDVFSHYTHQKMISFAKIYSATAKTGFILKHGFKVLQKNLDKYVKARQHFSSSLKELRLLAEAPRCRLESSFNYFEVPLQQKKSTYCLQCDLCQKYKRM